jgi:hypothetical protein
MIDIPNQFIPTTFSWLNQEKNPKKYKKSAVLGPQISTRLHQGFCDSKELFFHRLVQRIGPPVVMSTLD